MRRSAHWRQWPLALAQPHRCECRRRCDPGECNMPRASTPWRRVPFDRFRYPLSLKGLTRNPLPEPYDDDRRTLTRRVEVPRALEAQAPPVRHPHDAAPANLLNRMRRRGLTRRANEYSTFALQHPSQAGAAAMIDASIHRLPHGLIILRVARQGHGAHGTAPAVRPKVAGQCARYGGTPRPMRESYQKVCY